MSRLKHTTIDICAANVRNKLANFFHTVKFAVDRVVSLHLKCDGFAFEPIENYILRRQLLPGKNHIIFT